MQAVTHIVILSVVLMFFILPQTHTGRAYDENGKKILKKHSHYLWQKNHVH